MPRVSICCKGNRGKIDPRTIKRRALRILKAAGRPSAELSILLCDDAFIETLNREYRSKNSATDVLSFSMNEGEMLHVKSELLGDIAVSVETAARQASSMNRTLTDEVTSLIIHGILHLLGFDHNTKKADKTMQAEALRIEEKI